MKVKTFSLIVLLVIAFVACGVSDEEKGADAIQAEQTKKALGEAQRQIGMPNIVNFQQRKMMKWIYELADKEKLVTYTYIVALNTGKFIFVGKSLGYGIPFAAQFTNPQKVVEMDIETGSNWSGFHPGILSQADPNGLFMPTSSSATWVIMIHPKTGEPKVMYWEPTITVSPFPLSDYYPKGYVILRGNHEDDWGKKIK